MEKGIKQNLIYPELSYQIVGCVFEVYKHLGYGLKEKYYQKALAEEFKRKNLKVKEQAYYPMTYKGQVIGKNYFDFIIEDKVIVEIKKNRMFSRATIEQVVTYLRASELKLALLINFGKEGAICKRILNNKE